MGEKEKRMCVKRRSYAMCFCEASAGCIFIRREWFPLVFMPDVRAILVWRIAIVWWWVRVGGGGGAVLCVDDVACCPLFAPFLSKLVV